MPKLKRIYVQVLKEYGDVVGTRGKETASKGITILPVYDGEKFFAPYPLET